MTSYRKVDVWLSDIIWFSGFWTCKYSCLMCRTWAGARGLALDLPHFRRPLWELGFWLFGGGRLSVVLRRNFILGQKTLSQSLFHWIWHTLYKAVFWVSQHFPSKIHFVRKLATSFHSVLAAQIPCKEKKPSWIGCSSWSLAGDITGFFHSFPQIHLTKCWAFPVFSQPQIWSLLHMGWLRKKISDSINDFLKAGHIRVCWEWWNGG